MPTSITGGQINLNTSSSEAGFNAPQNLSLYHHLDELIITALIELEPHVRDVRGPVSAPVSTVVDISVDPENVTVMPLNEAEALVNAYEAQNKGAEV